MNRSNVKWQCGNNPLFFIYSILYLYLQQLSGMRVAYIVAHYAASLLENTTQAFVIFSSQSVFGCSKQ